MKRRVLPGAEDGIVSLDSFLNVGGREALLEAVRCCWTLLFSERAVYYRQRRILSPPKTVRVPRRGHG